MTEETTVHDPVCGMDIDPADAAATSQYEGKTIYFCATHCKRTFDADPAKFMKGTGNGGDHHGR